MRIVIIVFFLLLMTGSLQAQNTAVEYINKAIYLQKEKDFETSVLACDKAIELEPGLADAWFLRGYNNYLLEKYKEAVTDFTIAIELKPDYVDAIYYRARAKQANGNYLGALKDYNQSREVDGLQTTIVIARSLFGSVFGGSGKQGETSNKEEVKGRK